MSDDWTSKPYAAWLEDTIREMVKSNPTAIAMEMVTGSGDVYTCYYNVSANIRACMIDAMRDDAMEAWVRGNADIVRAILEGEEDEEDGLSEDDTEADGEAIPGGT